MKNVILNFLLLAALAGPGVNCFADDTNVTGNNNNPATHPVNAYRNHEVKKDIRATQVNSQKAKEDQALYEQAKADYEKSLKDNGAESPVTIDAKKRMAAAHQAMRKHVVQEHQAKKELKADEMKAQQ